MADTQEQAEGKNREMAFNLLSRKNGEDYQPLMNTNRR